MRRHITLNFRDVIGIEDEVLDVHSEQVDKASKAGTLTGEAPCWHRSVRAEPAR